MVRLVPQDLTTSTTAGLNTFSVDPGASQPRISHFVPSAITGADVIARRLQSLMGRKTLHYPLERLKYYMRFSVYQHHRSSLTDVNPMGHQGDIIMPLPTPIVDAQSIAYDEQSYGVVGWGIDALSHSLNQLGASATEADRQRRAAQAQAERDRILQQFPDAGQRSTAQQFLDRLVGQLPGGLGTAAAAALGFAPNQFMTIVLTGPKYKTFELNWTLAPNHPQEADSLRAIVKAFQNASAVGKSTTGLLWAFPKIFKIAIYPNSQYMMKFKPCVLTDLAINYTPLGQPAFHRPDPRTADEAGQRLGTPAAIQISTKWLELEYWLEGMYNDNNDPFSVTEPAITRPFSGIGF